MSRTLEEIIDNEFTLNEIQLSNFIKMMSPFFFDNLRWAKSMNFLSDEGIKSFGDIRTVVSRKDGKEIINYYPDPNAVKNFFSGMRKRGYLWVNNDLEAWSSQNAITPIDIVSKVQKMYEKRINYEKAQLYSLEQTINPQRFSKWIDVVYKKLGREFKLK